MLLLSSSALSYHHKFCSVPSTHFESAPLFQRFQAVFKDFTTLRNRAEHVTALIRIQASSPMRAVNGRIRSINYEYENTDRRLIIISRLVIKQRKVSVDTAAPTTLAIPKIKICFQYIVLPKILNEYFMSVK